MLLDDAAVDQMLLDDALEDGRIARGIPRAFGVDDGDRPAFADPQAVRLRAEDAPLLRQPELLQSPLEKLPRGETAILVAALRVRLIAAEKDVPPCHADANRRRDAALRLRRRTHRDSTRGRAHSAAPCSRRSRTPRPPPDWRGSLPRRYPFDFASCD